MTEEHNFIENNLIILSKQTIDIFLKYEKPSDLLSLYIFYYYTAKWQKTPTPKCTTTYASKGLKWSEERLRKTKKVLIEIGLIKNITDINQTTKQIKGHYIQINYIWNNEDTKNLSKPDSRFDQRVANVDTNALSVNSLNALSVNKRLLETTKSSSTITPTGKEKTDRQPRTYEKDSIPRMLAEHLFNLIICRIPNYFGPTIMKDETKYEKKINEWSNTMRLMLEKDKRDPLEMIDLMSWCQSDEFWQNNILSAYKFKDKVSTLLTRMAESNSASSTAKRQRTLKVKEEDKELFEKLLLEYSKKILKNTKYYPTGKDFGQFLTTVGRINKFSEISKLKALNIPEYLMKCLKKNYIELGITILPGHLCSDRTWNILFPQYLTSIGINYKKS